MVANLITRGLPWVSNFFIEDKSCFLVMDLIDGQSLERLLNQSGAPLPQELVLAWAYEVCQVLEYLHALNPPVIFRDMKPSNIMVARDGHVKLIDFGISKTFEADGGTRTIIKGAGTPGFAPPEQYATQQQRTDPRSDVYALGATLYTLLAFKVPIEATQRMMDQVMVLQVGEGISPVLDGLIAKMLELQPAQRPQSVKEVREALLAILGSPPPMDPITLPAELQWAPLQVSAPLDDATILPPRPSADRMSPSDTGATAIDFGPSCGERRIAICWERGDARCAVCGEWGMQRQDGSAGVAPISGSTVRPANAVVGGGDHAAAAAELFVADNGSGGAGGCIGGLVYGASCTAYACPFSLPEHCRD